MPTILIVDDTAANLEILSELLSPEHVVRAVRSGERALRAAQSTPRPDLILLDIMMPEMDGYEVLRRLKTEPATADIPVIFVTALDTVANEMQGLELGAVDYVAKPIRPAILMARVRTHLELAALRRQLRERDVQLEFEIGRRRAESRLAQDVGIRALAHLAEIRDPGVTGHLRRIPSYLRSLAVPLRSHPRFSGFLSDDNLNTLVRSSTLYDIGKVGVPDRILLKPGKLDPAEWEITKAHTRLGRDAIEMAEMEDERSPGFLNMAKDVALHHHERWDGSGYPDGLAEDEIPISARMMALADVFDALISDRVYKAASSFAEGVDIVRDGRGSQFDPAVVDAFLDQLDDFAAIASRRHPGHAASNDLLTH
ncbi:response regulator [Imhoffiella purpurea]|uniref:Response regulator receiver:Metal-dependent phosphohydrolase n=1 Tax=Imhoffiella purpurea TaxID=1249627 RepID=W9W189_9GAMM|nr:HD domain-containing phosphohydrolase [Imhoffiella purpurea]EXJ16340.1 Response regulator receiver:Metal-dependent phosphohydrolase [Imhoffiella purpurea]